MLTTDAPTTTRAVRDLRPLWRRGLAALLPVPALLLAAEALVRPYVLAADPEDQVAAAVAATGRLDLALWLGLLGGLLALPAVLAVAWTTRRHAPRLALAGGVLAALGVTLSYCLPHPGLALRAAVGTGLDAAAVGAAVEAVATRPSSLVALVGLLACQAVGAVLLGLALWRTPGAPCWAAVALAVSGPVHLAAAVGTVLDAGSSLLAAAGSAGASLALLRTRDADFDLAPWGAAGPTVGRHTSGYDARPAWQVILLVTAPVAAAWVALGRFLLPYDTLDDARTVFDKLLAAPGFLSFTEWAGLLASTCTISGVVAVLWVSRRRAPVLTTLAAALAVPGYTALAAGGSPGVALVALAADGQIGTETAYLLGAGAEALPQATAMGFVFVAGHLLGTVLLGLALWRSRALPAWVGLLLAVSQPVHLYAAMTGNNTVDLVAWGATACCFLAAGVAAARLPRDEFDLAPVDRGA